MSLTIQLQHSESQTAFNVKRWRELLSDLERVEWRNGESIGGRLACTSHPEKRPRAKDDDEEDWDNSSPYPFPITLVTVRLVTWFPLVFGPRTGKSLAPNDCSSVRAPLACRYFKRTSVIGRSVNSLIFALS